MSSLGICILRSAGEIAKHDPVYSLRSARLPSTNRDGTKTGASNGGVWEWCSTEFAAYEGWRTSELYPGYSEDFFDGCHWIMLGGSFGEYLSH